MAESQVTETEETEEIGEDLDELVSEEVRERVEEEVTEYDGYSKEATNWPS